ncbi:zinc finger protein 341 [Culicoides brevitarsis]|uniref:zinc finger protein 341 n=1 Tax=Culicoides brevitarsis TaxID=469753 RepID=UPI00307C3E57
MTMDIQTNQVNKLSPSIKGNTTIDAPPKAKVKRSFDVAFLMLSDDKKTRREKQFRGMEDTQVRPTELTVRSDLTVRPLPPTELLEEPKITNNNISPSKVASAYEDHIDVSDDVPSSFVRLTKIYDDPMLSEPPRSAFSKVHHGTPNHSPVPPMSPEQLSCPSASPPSSPLHASYYPFINGSAFQAINQSHTGEINKLKQLMYHQQVQQQRRSPPQNTPSPDIQTPPTTPNIQATYMGRSPPPPYPFAATASPFLAHPPNPATILSALLPTAISPFQLTAQNVCAKCNISFRMTSDLVYHMRSHHKSEYAHDPNRRKREEKLKCSVCSESFRERHHLTRHMTAHQDKEGDLLDGTALLEFQARKKRNNMQH